MKVLDEIEAAIPALRRYARALMRDRDRADDLVQDCLERAVASRHLWRGDGPVQAWLFRILINRYRDLQRRSPLPGHLVAIEDLVSEPAQCGGQEGALALREVQEAIARLPVDQREALLIVALEGRSFEEAASLLDIPKGTLMSRLARARATLRVLTGRGTGAEVVPGPSRGRR
ncbi:MAG TPA: RNA polymerase subunit sigma [Citreicella sp.]|jgi:RNA polymerase sigma-70 factor, ECF subfamily|uniref:sigma-70 family RNA polymerase sigma factor n=1 Tax=Salipiger marinus TaxID=555512 RepID=UPI000E8651CE|nr:sigma-70 family RNA polymerase sigma factor [Salipiger manganoxidans]MCD1618074.1 sigma-70 family RNA polymerase sigma factor [Salipiger manganoxidans]HBM61805.1 RNA polymerase subunit sigma [Citreicella sp.]HBS98364.1 RNA polymerase subunit sigma [Citreicella sp.]